MNIHTGNVITVGKTLYVVHDITAKKMYLVNAYYESRAILYWKIIDDIMVASVMISKQNDDMTDSQFDNFLIKTHSVNFIAKSIKNYITERTTNSFKELYYEQTII